MNGQPKSFKKVFLMPRKLQSINWKLHEKWDLSCQKLKLEIFGVKEINMAEQRERAKVFMNINESVINHHDPLED